MTAKSVLVRPQGLRPKARAPTCPHSLSPPLATPLLVSNVPSPDAKASKVEGRDTNEGCKAVPQW